MASRQEEKEARRREREAVEAKEQAAAARSKRLQLVGGGVLVAAIVVVAALLLLSKGSSDGGPTPTGSDAVPIPAPGKNATNLELAAKAAKCTLLNPPSEGRTHTAAKVTYRSNPPTSGNHDPIPAEDGIYDPGNTPAKEAFVHTLEHGRIELQYKPGTPKRVVGQLETLFNEKSLGQAGYHTVLFENTTKMPYAVAATAWTHLIGCKAVTPQTWDALRAFRARYTDKAPEAVP